MQKQFKVGDKVRRSKNWQDSFWSFGDSVLTVTGLQCNSGTNGITFEDAAGADGVGDSCRFDLVEPAPKPPPAIEAVQRTFQVGDKVKCVEGNRFFSLVEGQVYTVEEIINNYGDLRLKEIPDEGWFNTRFVPATTTDEVDSMVPTFEALAKLKLERAELVKKLDSLDKEIEAKKRVLSRFLEEN